MTAPTTEGEKPLRPSFPLQLSYEWYIREKAFDLVKEEGLTLTDALRKARKDPEIRLLKFVTPLSLEGKKNQDQTSLWREQPPTKYHKGEGKGKDKGKGKGAKDIKGGKKSGKSRNGLLMEWNGEQICFKYSNKISHDSATCGRAHVCQMPSCQGAKHPLKDCPSYKGKGGKK